MRQRLREETLGRLLTTTPTGRSCKSDYVERGAGRSWTLLDGITATPHGKSAELPPLSASQYQQILVDWNQTETTYPAQTCVHTLLQAQAERTPDLVAVECGDQRLTYRQLHIRANRLAHRLRSLGVGPDVLVGLCVERSLEMVVGLLSILKAGGAYVPLNPEFPPERLALLVADASPIVLLTQETLRARLPVQHPQVVCLDLPALMAWDDDAIEPMSGARPEHLAYVLYTSGSTGKPKGVLVPHQALVNLLAAMRQTPGLSADDVVLAVTPPSFDIHTLEIWLPLMIGARVVLASRAEAADGIALARLLSQTEATFLQATPATWRLLLAAGWEGSPRLKALSGGEALPIDLARQVRDRVRELWNLYGPTETTVYSTFHRVEEMSGLVPIGRPIANTQVYVLDEQQRPVSVGVTGELYIGGAGLARGYLNRPELTAERFVANPFRAGGERLYRTGDRVRWRADGELEFLGRLDRQVKIRGFRIEPGEVEAVLAEHAQVAEAAVLPREDRPGDIHLVAYVVADRGTEPTVGDLRSFLNQRLPEYMVPSAFVMLERMPRTANGKLDRMALSARGVVWPQRMGEYTPPWTEAQKVISAIWADVLGVQCVGIHDNFFELGGHSLMATQVIARVREAFGIELPLGILFEAPSVAGLAQQVETASRATAPPLLPNPSKTERTVSFAQERLWFIDQFEPGKATYNVPLPVRLRGKLDEVALKRALAEVVRRHEVLRTTFHSVNGQPDLMVGEASAFHLPIRDLTSMAQEARDAEALRVAGEQTGRPFDLTTEWPLRAELLRLAEDDHLLALTIHHLAFDDWSGDVLNRELSALYRCFIVGEPSPLSEPMPRYSDFAAWQRQWLQGDERERQLSYWRQRLAGAPALPRVASRSAAASRADIPRGTATAEVGCGTGG